MNEKNPDALRRNKAYKAEKMRQYRERDRMAKIIQLRGQWNCVSREVVDQVVEIVQPGMRIVDVANAMGIDFHAAGRFLKEPWVSEDKLDRFLAAMGCEHLWRTEPFLDEIREELIRRAA